MENILTSVDHKTQSLHKELTEKIKGTNRITDSAVVPLMVRTRSSGTN
jgi:hypothetical protein